VHEDLEFSVLSSETKRYRRILSDLEFYAVKDGRLRHLPLTDTLPIDVWQQWGADPAAGCWRVDMMVDRGSHDLWVYKRDPSLTMPRTEAIRETAEGVQYLAPSIVLLFKAKHVRDKDNEDFCNALPRLDLREKSDLRRWLEAMHPGHKWIEALKSG
jgi:hypothetical protein